MYSIIENFYLEDKQKIYLYSNLILKKFNMVDARHLVKTTKFVEIYDSEIILRDELIDETISM